MSLLPQQLLTTSTPLSSVAQQQFIQQPTMTHQSGQPQQTLINTGLGQQPQQRQGMMGGATTSVSGPTIVQQQNTMLSVLQNNPRFRQVFEKATPEQRKVLMNFILTSD